MFWEFISVYLWNKREFEIFSLKCYKNLRIYQDFNKACCPQEVDYE
jgi:hypothetical protein